jgi:hypothetical protein
MAFSARVGILPEAVRIIECAWMLMKSRIIHLLTIATMPLLTAIRSKIASKRSRRVQSPLFLMRLHRGSVSTYYIVKGDPRVSHTE